MSPAIRLGDPGGDDHRAPPPAAPRLDRSRLELDGIATRMIRTRGHGAPAVLLHGWLDNAETWLAVLERLAAIDRAAIAYDQPGFGVAPPLGPGNVLDQLADFAEEAVLRAAERTKRKVVVVGNSLGGWVALRLAERRDLPIAGVVPIGPAGIRMAPLFFTADRIPAVSQIIGLPAPVPPAVTRRVVERLYRALAFGNPASVEQAVVDRFTQFNVDRPVIRQRLDYAKRLRDDLEDPFDADAIDVPVTVIWGDRDRLCVPAGARILAGMLPHAKIVMLEGIGHTPQVEAPDVVVEAIEELAARA
ncbi:MAG: alpha/beta hydrolase [Actinomycetota bacterium]|nr:alpha/beta hydrolase [Actinomycetota bacterium]